MYVYMYIISFIIYQGRQLNLEYLFKASLSFSLASMSDPKSQIIPQPHTCKNGYLLRKICIQSTCNHNTYCCDNVQCQYCSDLDQQCRFIYFKQIYDNILQNQNKHRQYYQQLIKMDYKMIEMLKESHKKVSDKMSTAGLSYIKKNTLYKLFVKEDFKNTTKKQIIDLIQQFKSNNLFLQRQKYNKIQRNQSFVKQSLQYFNKIIKNKQNYIQNVMKIQSNIINDYHDVQYIYQLLNFNPFQLHLIFRASQHAFSARQFHLKCDNLPNTITIIKTEYGGIIIAFSSQKWYSGQSNYSKDLPKTSFIASIKKRHKLLLKQQNYAIFCDRNHGPCFGRGFDLKIVDKCNINNNNYFFGPYSYGFDDVKVEHKMLWNDFIGRDDGYRFRVTDYQVFKVVQ